MKAGTESKAKFKKLQRRLGLTVWQAAGLLEMLWQVTARDAPAGDIGRLSNEDIAATIGWSDDEDELIANLVACGWIDEDETHRLVVHAWQEHAPNYIKALMVRHGKKFAKEGGESTFQATKESRRKVEGSDWETRRSEVLDRDNHTCRYCGYSAKGPQLQVDHVLEISKGGGNEPDNLVACCANCNALMAGWSEDKKREVLTKQGGGLANEATTKPSQAKPSATKPSATKPSATKPNQVNKSPSETLSTGVDGIPTIQEFFDRWNKLAKSKSKLSRCTKLTKERQAKIRSRLTEPGWFEDFRRTCRLLPLPTREDSTWQPSLDWLIRNEQNVYRILEGEFSWRSDNPAARKLDEQKRKREIEAREQRIRQQKQKKKVEAAGTQRAMDDILQARNGSEPAERVSTLLFGEVDVSSANGAEHPSLSGETSSEESKT